MFNNINIFPLLYYLKNIFINIYTYKRYIKTEKSKIRTRNK